MTCSTVTPRPRLGAWAEAEYGRVDILVNNAGYSSTVRSIRYVPVDEWSEVFTINVDAVYRLTQTLLQGMIDRGEGTIITVSSMAALNPGPLGGAPYSAAKAASLTIMKYINTELRNTGVRASTIVPAEVDTPLIDKRAVSPPAEERGTMMGPRDVAEAILLCATRASADDYRANSHDPVAHPRSVTRRRRAGARRGAVATIPKCEPAERHESNEDKGGIDEAHVIGGRLLVPGETFA